ncbi:MAG: polyprenyl synthetase family protein [Deltaproteobacteria bacterium]|jgi:geranylgeranyl diphosphate synthase type II|nr:polyprenyl synthetase family protein [Deltaproteobacteria bacterium]
MNDLALYIENGKKLIDEFIKAHFIKKHYDKKFPHNKFSLADAMLYTLTMPGKRIRPIILLLSAESLGFYDKKKLLPFASSLELIHSYSLIHDDLPSMDNDDLRRGKPTSHIVFGEATAILAGDALLAEAFVMLSDKDYIEEFDPVKIIEIVSEFSCAAGAGGLVEGQFHDVNSFGEHLDFEKIEYINEKKTASLIASACAAGAILSGNDEKTVSEFRKFGGYIGMAFQAVDDVLGITGNKEILGKTAGIDRINNKLTMAENIGLERTRKLIEEYNKKAMAHLEKTGAETGMFIELIKYLTDRIN